MLFNELNNLLKSKNTGTKDYRNHGLWKEKTYVKRKILSEGQYIYFQSIPN